ncbi:MAG: hypothetical protein GKR88_06635 [Flavobacteriaceae bacterium]|nr:MAG: hypothetical protein GKR88_06635 [Flavobacteriaceae bacterium]
MKKHILIITILFFSKNYAQNILANKNQKKWFSTVELGFSIPNETKYNSSLLDVNGNYLEGLSLKLSNKATYGALYTLNYPILRRLSLGVIGGYSYHIQPEISNVKLGGIIRYHFVDANLANFYLLSTYRFSLNENFKNGGLGGNIRLGISFSILEEASYSLILNGFWNYSSHETKKPLILSNEGPGFIFIKGYGISLGIQF